MDQPRATGTAWSPCPRTRSEEVDMTTKNHHGACRVRPALLARRSPTPGQRDGGQRWLGGSGRDLGDHAGHRWHLDGCERETLVRRWRLAAALLAARRWIARRSTRPARARTASRRPWRTTWDLLKVADQDEGAGRRGRRVAYQDDVARARLQAGEVHHLHQLRHRTVRESRCAPGIASRHTTVYLDRYHFRPPVVRRCRSCAKLRCVTGPSGPCWCSPRQHETTSLRLAGSNGLPRNAALVGRSPGWGVTAAETTTIPVAGHRRANSWAKPCRRAPRACARRDQEGRPRPALNGSAGRLRPRSLPAPRTQAPPDAP